MRTTVPVTTLLILVMLVLLPAVVSAQSDATGNRIDRARSYELTITSNVRDATIYIDGTRQRRRTPGTFELRPGGHTIRVEARGYEPFETRIELTSDMTVQAELLPPTATIILEVPVEYLNDRVRDPWSEIDLYIDGRLRNEAQVEVDPGFRDVTIVSGGLRISSEFRFEAGETYSIELILRTGLYQQGR